MVFTRSKYRNFPWVCLLVCFLITSSTWWNFRLKHGEDNVGNYSIVRQLGSGRAGKVYSGFHRSNPINPLAIKEIKLDRPKNWVTGQQEAFIGNLLNVSLQEAIIKQYDHFTWNGRLWLVYELMKGGELLDHMLFIRERRSLMKNTIFRLLQGMEYYTSKRVLLRDIKLDNILLDEAFNPKWSDFGDAVALDYIRDAKTNPDGYWWDTMKTVSRLNPYLRAPEQRYTISPFICPSWSFDMWGFGIIVLSLGLGDNVLQMRRFHLSHEITKSHQESAFQQKLIDVGGHHFLQLIKDMLHSDCSHRVHPIEAMFSEYFLEGRNAVDVWGFSLSTRERIFTLIRSTIKTTTRSCASDHYLFLQNHQCFLGSNSPEQARQQSWCEGKLHQARNCTEKSMCSLSRITSLCSIFKNAQEPQAANCCWHAMLYVCKTFGVPVPSR